MESEAPLASERPLERNHFPDQRSDPETERGLTSLIRMGDSTMQFILDLIWEHSRTSYLAHMPQEKVL